MATKRNAEEMSKPDDQDPDYEMVTTMTSSKRIRLLEQDAKDATTKRIEAIIRRQFDIEMRHKEKEVILIDERVHQARAILDKLRACIVASYYGNVSSYPAVSRGEISKRSKLDLNHPAIQRVIKLAQPAQVTPAINNTIIGNISPGIGDAALAALVEETNGDLTDGNSRPETPLTPMLNGDHISELLSSCSTPDSEKLSLSDLPDLPGVKGPRNTGENTFGVGPPLPAPKPIVPQASSEDGSRFHVKKRIIVGNVSKYISPENREDSDPSTHKWMVYVRGPHNEPRIDHFVKKIWFFLHPSYRPNDLVEVKEPPFHLTRRGWGEFPIRVQLHFVDPRNKKVDIIHHLKLDRTYTGLQTLGAETIVDVELDRYLFDEAGEPVSRPSTPTVTSVKYKEGCKPEPTSPGANVIMPTTPSPLVGLPDIRAKTPSTPMEQSPAPSPSLQGSRKGTPTPELLPPPSSKIQPFPAPSGTTTLGTMSIKEQGGAITAVIGAGGIKTQVKSLPTVGPQLAVQQQQGGRFVRVMPPLGPITAQAKMTAGLTSLSTSTTMAKTPPSVSTQQSDAGASLLKLAVTESDKMTSVVTPDLAKPLSAATSPTATAVNVAEAAASTSPGKGPLAVRIQEGKLVADVSPTAQLAGNIVKLPAAAATGLVSAASVTGLVQAASATGLMPVASATGLVPAAPTLSTMTQIVTPASQTVASVSTSAALQIPGVVSPQIKPVVTAAQPTQPKAGSAGGIKVIPTRAPSLTSPTQGQPTSFPVIPNPPPGTQYYITAKSTDPNLQGKVILIPQQVFAQASGQSVLVGSKGGRPGPSQIQGKGGAALKPTPASKSSFLSPSNVLILPQGSIVPPLPPGSIVQIQQVPSPSRTPQQTQPKPRLAVPQKSASAPALVAARGQAPRAAGIPSGGIIQIQRTTGPSTAKVLSSQPGVNPSTASTSGISILPEKGTLAKTPSGGVVFVQRSPSTGKLNAQPVTGISVAGQSGIPQKVALAAQLTSSGSLRPGSTVSIIQGTGKPAGQTVVLQSPLGLPKLQQVKTIQQTVARPTQPIILGQTAAGAASTSSHVQLQGQLQTQALISSQGKVQLVSVVPPGKNPEKQQLQAAVAAVAEAAKFPGQTPMALSHEVTIETSETSPPPEEETQKQGGEDVKTVPMEVGTPMSDASKISKSDASNREAEQEASVALMNLASSEHIAGRMTIKQPEIPPPAAQIITTNVSTTGTVSPTTAVVTSHGLVQVQAPTELVLGTTIAQQPKTSTIAQIAVGSLPMSTPIAVTTAPPPAETIQIKQEVLSPVKVASSAPVFLSQPGASLASIASIAPRTFVVPSAPTTLLTAPGASTTILTPNIAGTLLRPMTSTTLSGATISRFLGTAPSSTILRPSTSSTILSSALPSTILSSVLPSTLLGPTTIGQQTIIVTSALPQVVGVQPDIKVKVQEVDDPLLVELRRRSREGPVSVYALETMEDLVKVAVEKIPLINGNRVQSDHPFMTTSLEHYYSWNIGKRRSAEWHRAIAVKDMAREAAKRCNKLKDVEGWSTKKIMWWCRRHGYTPQDVGVSKPRQWCNVCGEVELKQDEEGETKPHNCTAKWMSSTGLLQNTSYTTSDDFVKSIQEKQQELGQDDNDSDIEIDVINISKESRQVRVKKEVEEKDNRIKCFLPPSDGARLVTDTAHEIGVQYKPVEITDGTYSNVAQEMVFTATKQFLSDLIRGSFANAYGDRKEHRYPTEILPTHVFETITRNKKLDFLTNHQLGIPMPESDDENKDD